jgi:hypothetical protein
LKSNILKGKENKIADALSQSVHTIHLETTSVGESDIKQRIKNLFRGDDLFTQVKEGYNKNPGRENMRDIGFQLMSYCITTGCMCLNQEILGIWLWMSSIGYLMQVTLVIKRW